MLSQKNIPGICEIVEKVGYSDISSIQPIFTKIIGILKNPASSASELKAVIEIDPPLCAKILSRANSSYFGIQREISSIQEAIIFLGFNTVNELALNLKIEKIFDKDTPGIPNYSRKMLWKHSLAVAMCCKSIYRREFRQRGEDIYSAALLHDIGIIIEDQFLADEFKLIAGTMFSEKISLWDAEKRILDYDHSALGKKLVSAWHLPEEFAEAIGAHHSPLDAGTLYPRPTYTLYVADYICHLNGIGFENKDGWDSEIFMECLNRLGISLEGLDLIFMDMCKELEKLEESGDIL